MKKKVIIFFIFTISIFIIKYKYTYYKCRNINYAAENYLTKGFFNKYKIYGINRSQIKFSDGKTAVIQIEGISKKTPRRNVSYNLFLEKNQNQIWKIKKIYKNSN
ncbi:hypothetical protein CLOACE_14960 [Clostridium acetireducens DSM 10703]|uniref:DUF4829 domain-containing protein n=1 Tax=Clostridium acetireducens DSM 10703 TaxID=1121290 RepID=A0A1E8EY63_9CLOT|nr:hypothetical protein [Clostridium acetireducens]OFI05878.1 hypothetical protein CLOACE_14960 [Clostridium acetireducens DSM 10703]